MSVGLSLQAAIDLHNLGIVVVRAPRKSKGPSRSWRRYQTQPPTLREIAEDFGEGRSDDNVFVVCGPVSRLVALDFDDLSRLDWWRDTFGAEIDEAARVDTSRGCHIWFRTPPGVAVPTRDLGGCEVRGERVGVIAPPSIHESGRRYVWAEDRGLDSLRDASDELLAYLLGTPEPSRGPRAGLNGNGAAHAPEWEPLDLKRYYDGIPAGERDSASYKLACSLRAQGLTEALALAQAEVAWQSMEQPRGDEFPLEVALEKVERVYREKPAGRSAAFNGGGGDGEGGGSGGPGGGRGATPKLTVAAQLVELAKSTHEFIQSVEGTPYAVPLEGPALAMSMIGDGSSFRSYLDAAYYDREGKFAGGEALVHAVGYLKLEAERAAKRPLHVRAARIAKQAIVIDLGGPSGTSIEVTPERWEVVRRRNAVFHRTKLTQELPEPVRGGSLDAVRGLMNVSDEQWDLLVGFMVASWIPDIPHPILLLSGTPGSAKSSAMKLISYLLDPSAGGVRRLPKDDVDMAVMAHKCWVSGFDNVSWISKDMSDALCCLVTGDAIVRRGLYTNDEPFALEVRRVAMMNGVAVGGFKTDLGDRFLALEFQRIPESDRLTEEEWDERRERARPPALGALLDLLSATLAALPEAQVAGGWGRMADFERVLAAVDGIRCTRSLETYREAREAIAEQAVIGDPLATAIREIAEDAAQATTDGTVEVAFEGWGAVLDAVKKRTPGDVYDRLPKGSAALSKRLRYVEEELRKVGVEVVRPTNNKDRTVRIRRQAAGGES